jgi:hypothetical protein
MGAAAESRRAASRERRLLREVDPELAVIKDQEELEHARIEARRERRGRGMPQVDPGPGSKPSGCGCFFALCVLGFVLFCVLIAGPLNEGADEWYTVEPTTTQGK